MKKLGFRLAALVLLLSIVMVQTGCSRNLLETVRSWVRVGDEAANVDGATAWQKFRYITFPMLASAMTVSVMLLLLNSMKLYDLPFALTSEGPGTSTTLVSQIIIKTGFVEKSYGKATAMSAIFFVFIAVISVIQLKLMKKRDVE